MVPQGIYLVCLLLCGFATLVFGQGCLDLPPPTNGGVMFDMAAETNGRRPVGTVATLSCNSGYFFGQNSGNAQRTCQSNGQWDRSSASCGVPCPVFTVTDVMVDYFFPDNNNPIQLPDIPDFPDTAAPNIRADISCTGSATTSRFCQADGTWNGTTTCQITVSCPNLTMPTNINGEITYSAGVVTGGRASGTTATYSCITDYMPEPSPITCQPGGMWSSSPACLRICDDLPPIPNGMVSPGPPRLEGATVTYSCRDGFLLVLNSGDEQRTCGSTGQWNGSPPTCDVPCPDLTVTNGQPIMYSAGTSGGRPVNTVATITCNSGFTLVGFNTRTCQSGRVWNGSDTTCQNCPFLNQPNGGTITFSSGSSTDRPIDTVATYSCDTGYTLVGVDTLTCQAGQTVGAWSSDPPTCELTCPDLTPPANGAVVYSDPTLPRAEGSTANYSCDSGYVVTGDSVRMCTSSGWSGSDPVCTATCPDLPPPTNGGISYNPNATTLRLEGTVATHSCAGGYQLSGGSERTCRSDRTWSGGNITCTIIGTGSGDSGAAVGGAVVAVVVVVILLIVIIVVVVLVLRYMRLKVHHYQIKSQSPLSTVYAKSINNDNGAAFVKKEEEPTISTFPSETRAVEGEEVCLRVKVGGHPPPTLTWYRDGKEVTPDYATELDDDGTLTFPSVEVRHAGIYRLEVTNSLGSVEQQVRLVVTDEKEEAVSSSANLGPVTVAQLGGYVTEMHANGNQKFKENYKALDSGEKNHQVTVAKIPENKLCNRFGNIAVYDDNRIELQPIPDREDCQSDYINACYVDGYSVPRKFIATQGPIPRTVVDFWRLLWQERPPIIVMLTNLKEGNKIKCQPYWPESGAKKFGPFTVTITDQQVLADYIVRTLKVTVEGQRKIYKTVQYHFTSWPDHGVPEYATPILGYHRRVKSQHNPSKGPLLVHCSAGVGRTGTYIVIDNVLDQIAAEGVVDISGAIVKARNQRMKLVQTQDQYVFIHDAILESVTCGDTQINAGDLRRQVQKLSGMAEGKNCTGFQYQFQILEQVSPKPSEVVCSTAHRYQDKNRGEQYLPADRCRVVLKGDQPDYVHAVFAHGYKHQKAYVIAQNPLPSTVRNFWKVIYDKKCAAVVMLTPLRENGEEVCSQYWPEREGVTSFGEFTIDNLGEESFPDFTIRQLSVLSEKTQKAHQVNQFQILNWNRDGKLANLKTVTDIIEEVAKVQRRTGNKSIVVHCSDTATRSGMYCATATTIDRCKTEGVVDVFQVVKALRVYKPGAVPSVENYKDIFDIILVYLDSFDTYANFQE